VGQGFQDTSGNLLLNQWFKVARLQWESCCYSGSGLKETKSSELFRAEVNPVMNFYWPENVSYFDLVIKIPYFAKWL